MKFGLVVGKMISDNKVDNLKSLPLLIVEKMDRNLERRSKKMVCTDTVNANQGDIVLVCQSSSSRKTDQTRYVCTDASVVGIVDNVDSID